MTSLARRAHHAYAREAEMHRTPAVTSYEHGNHGHDHRHHGETHQHMPNPNARDHAQPAPVHQEITDSAGGAIPGIPEAEALDDIVVSDGRNPIERLDNGQVRPDPMYFYEVQTPDRRTVIRQARSPVSAVTSTWTQYRPIDGTLTLSAYEAKCSVREVPAPSNDGYELMRTASGVNYRVGDLVTIKAQPWEGMIGVILYPHEEYATKFHVGVPDMGVPIRCRPQHIEMYQPAPAPDAAPRMEDTAKPGDATMGLYL